MSRQRNSQFFRLLWSVCDGVATTDQCSALANQLAEDPAARRDYLRFLALHIDLASEGNAAEPRVFGGAAAAATRPAPVTAARTRSAILMASLVAFVFYGVFVMLAWNLRSEGQSHDGPGSPRHVANIPTPVRVAQLGYRDGAVVRRSDNQQTLRSGAWLIEHDELEVASGSATLIFKHGADVLLHAGARVRIVNADGASLHVGKLLAHVPQRARGFTIETAQTRVVDLGTEFAVLAHRHGSTDVHVFEGQVDVTPVSDQGITQPAVRLKAGEARRIRTAPATIGQAKAPAVWETLTAEKSAFEDSLDTPELADQEGLVLWLRAETIDQDDQTQVRKGPGGLYVVRWPDESRRWPTPADVGQAASERQPIWLPKALNGMPAVRFVRERMSCLLNETHALVPAGSPRTVFFVGRAAGREDRAVGGELLTMPRKNTDRPSFVIQHYFTGPHFLRNKYYVYSDLSGQDWTADDASSIITRPFVAMFRSAGAGSRAEIQLNEHSLTIATGAVTKEAALPGLIIGALGNYHLDRAQAWDGVLAEVLFYDRALSADVVQSVHKYLVAKYRIMHQ